MDRKCKIVINIVAAVIISLIIGIISGVLFRTNFLYFRFPIYTEMILSIISIILLFDAFNNDSIGKYGYNSGMGSYNNLTFFSDIGALSTGIAASTIVMDRTSNLSRVIYGFNIGFLMLLIIAHILLYRYISGGRSCKAN